VTRKPAASVAAVTAFLGERLGEPPGGLARLPEGLESQAFRFETGGEAFVLRIAASSRGFEKDRWAARAAGPHVPVPAVEEIGPFDDASAFCIMRLLPGVTVEDLPPRDAAGVVGEVGAAWEALASVDIAAISGFGDFDADGNAPAETWRDVLLTTLASPEPVDDDLALETYASLVERCPEERSLVHGDFGSNNVLVHQGVVSGVLDWELALVGDPLYDVGIARFWATSLPCMAHQSAHFDRTLSARDDFHERVLCYALRIGLEEAREATRDGDAQLAGWASARCRELALRGYPW
jgi:hygromycin-B 4-O-kinase